MFLVSYLAGCADNALFSLQTALIGILMVFAILTVLVLIVSLLKAILVRNKNKPEEQKVIEPAAPTQPALSAEEGVTPECVAAVMAAIACMYEEERPDVEFVVRSIKRKY